jgi:hypothetical protein
VQHSTLITHDSFQVCSAESRLFFGGGERTVGSWGNFWVFYFNFIFQQPHLYCTRKRLRSQLNTIKKQQCFHVSLYYPILWVFLFLIIQFQFNYWDDSWISIVIYRYMWWFEIVSFNWLLWCLFIKTLDIHCVSFYGYI